MGTLAENKSDSAKAAQARSDAAAAQQKANEAAAAKQASLAGQGGGRGVVGGQYGVQITNQSATSSGLKNATNNYNQSLGIKSSDWNEKANEYSNSLVNNKGIAAGSTAYNQAMDNYLIGNRLVATTKDSQPSPALQTFSEKPKPISYQDNFGYTKDVSPSPIITQNFSKNPKDVTFTVTQGGQKEINLFQASKGQNYGGVQTEKSKSLGDKYSRENLEKTPQSIGATIFTNQKQLVRGSVFENQVKEKEAERASQVYTSFAKKDYVTGGKKEEAPVVTLGKAQGFFGNKTSFGWKDISKDQLVRGSNEEKLSTLGAFAGRGNTRIDNQGGKPFGVSGGLTGGIKGNQVFQATKTGQATVLTKPEPKQEQPVDFNTFYQGAESRGSTINVFNQQGQKIGSFKATEQNKQGLDALAGSGVYFREAQSSSYDKVQAQEFRNTLSLLGSQGATINIFNSKNQLIGSVSGPNAYRDFIVNYGKINEPLTAQPVLSTTQQGKKETESLISGARNVGATSINVFTNQKGKEPTKIESLPLDTKAIATAIDKYSGNQNILFGYTPKQTENPKDTTLTPASILPLDLNAVSSKYFTGKYFNLEQVAGGFFSKLESESKQPITEKGSTITQFGVKFPNPQTSIYEAGQQFGSLVIGSVKSIPPTVIGVGTSYYNLITTGQTGGPKATPESPKAFGNLLGASILAPQLFMGETASKNYQYTSEFIHSKIGAPIKEQGINIPQPVQNPRTFGSFVGSLAGIGYMAASARSAIPIRIAGQEGTIAFPGIGRIKSAGPLAESEPYIQGPKTVTITGVVAGYGGPRTIMLFGKSSEGKSFVFSRLKPEYNPTTGKENLHLETYSSTAERGSPYPESTKLTLSKLNKPETGKVLEQIINQEGKPKFSAKEFNIEIAASQANKNYNKIPNQKVPEVQANEFFKQTSITESPEVTVQSKNVAKEAQSRFKSTKNAITALATGDIKLASSYGVFTISPLPAAKGSPIVAGQIGEYNRLQSESSNFIPQPPATSVKDIDIEITKEKQSQALTNILNAKVERPSGYEFTREGSNIYYGVKTGKGKEVFNLLTDKDVNPSDISTSSSGTVFGKSYPRKKSSLGGFKTESMAYQARALTNSLSATHNVDLIEKTKATTEPVVYSGILERLSKSEHIVTAFTPRLPKDLSRNIAVLEYGIKTTRGKARESFINYRDVLLESHPYVKLENITPEELAQQLSKSKQSSIKSPSNTSPISTQTGITPLSLVNSYKPISSKTSLFSTSSKNISQSSKSVLASLSKSSLKSTKSNLSSKSTLSTISPKSTKSSKSGSTLSTISPKSTKSNVSILSTSPTSSSSTSTKSSIPGSPTSPLYSSPSSPYSSPSYPSSSFSFTNYPNNPIKIPLTKLGNIGIKRKNKFGEGPTALINLGVKNIFSSSLSISISKGRRYEF